MASAALNEMATDQLSKKKNSTGGGGDGGGGETSQGRHGSGRGGGGGDVSGGGGGSQRSPDGGSGGDGGDGGGGGGGGGGRRFFTSPLTPEFANVRNSDDKNISEAERKSARAEEDKGRGGRRDGGGQKTHIFRAIYTKNASSFHQHRLGTNIETTQKRDRSQGHTTVQEEAAAAAAAAERWTVGVAHPRQKVVATVVALAAAVVGRIVAAEARGQGASCPRTESSGASARWCEKRLYCASFSCKTDMFAQPG